MELGPRILYFPDVCSHHKHHRSKLQVKRLKTHTMRHYGMAALLREQGAQAEVRTRFEDLVARKCKRKVGPPPAEGLKLETVGDVLFKMDAEWHKRKRGYSESHGDLVFCYSMVNGGLLNDEWLHHCWDEDKQAPCCEGQDETGEKTTVAVHNVLFGRSDPTPGESTWTHTLPNFKQTCLRAVIYGVGVDALPGPDYEGASASIDASSGAADDNYYKVLKSVRKTKTNEYVRGPKNLRELGVYTILLDSCDSILLYPLLGDPLAEDPEKPRKLDLILDPEKSKVSWNK